MCPPHGLRFILAGSWPDAQAVGRAHWHFFQKISYWQERRRLALPHLLVSQRAGTYSGSIVWAYFAQSKKTFSAILK
jgi:hypothetical protein